MKTIEIRRHSIRRPPDPHLIQQGVTLARLVGENIGPFDFVVTSTLPRAFETAIAMGFAVDEQVELLSSYGEAVEREVPYPQTFDGYAAAIRASGATADYARRLAEFHQKLAEYLADGRFALVVNHGGIVEMSAIACVPGAGAGESAPIDYCEGVRLFWEDGKFIRAEILRVSI